MSQCCIVDRLTQAVDVARWSGVAPVRIWLTHEDWSALCDVLRLSVAPLVRRYMGLPVTVCVGVSRVVLCDGRAVLLD